MLSFVAVYVAGTLVIVPFDNPVDAVTYSRFEGVQLLDLPPCEDEEEDNCYWPYPFNNEVSVTLGDKHYSAYFPE